MAGLEGNVSTLEVNGKSYTLPELLAYWIKEREAIRVKKENGEDLPWSEDPIFQSVYFCSVCREDDRVTRWVRSNYTPETFGEDYELAIVAARLFNWPPTLEEIKYLISPYNYENLRLRLEERKGRKEKVWGGAYLITTNGVPGSKIAYGCQLLEEAQHILPLRSVTLEGAHKELMQVRGLGSFLAAQIVADLKNTLEHPLCNAEDWVFFSAPGPGSLRGLTWFYGEPITPSKYAKAIEGVWEYLYDTHKLGRVGHMQDLQNCLCEFDKYCRVLTGTGRSKRIYVGTM